MPHTIVSDICEGVALCASACPVDCIKQAQDKNIKGTNYFYINFETCIDCGVCLAVCPIKGAVIAEEKQELQKSK